MAYAKLSVLGVNEKRSCWTKAGKPALGWSKNNEKSDKRYFPAKKKG